jgi:hypothetical protein
MKSNKARSERNMLRAFLLFIGDKKWYKMLAIRFLRP